jgi:polysaccharide export outer membrane protein
MNDMPYIRPWVLGSMVLCVIVAGCLGRSVDPAYEALAERTAAEQPETGQLGPGDKIKIKVFEEEDLSGSFTISEEGEINYPYAGRIDIGGMTCAQVERALTSKLQEGYLREPNISCAIDEYNSKRIYVLGEVKKPGSYPYKSNLTIIEAFAIAGGSTDRADTSATKLTRLVDGKEVQVRVPMQSIVEGRKRNIQLLPGDVVYVPESAF